MDYLQVRNWDKWQSYRSDRSQPPWIKLHRCLMRNQDWVALTDAQRGQLVSIWLLAADRNGNIPKDPKVIKKLCYMDSEPDMNLFIEHGFIEVDATMTPERRQDDANVTQQTRLDKTRLDKTIKTPMSSDAQNDVKAISVPYQKIVDLYHEVLPNNPKVRVLTQARKAAIKQRHLHDMDCNLDEWVSYFELIKRSKFLTGQTSPINGGKIFIADLEWVTKQGNFAKIYEGKYHG